MIKCTLTLPECIIIRRLLTLYAWNHIHFQRILLSIIVRLFTLQFILILIWWEIVTSCIPCSTCSDNTRLSSHIETTSILKATFSKVYLPLIRVSIITLLTTFLVLRTTMKSWIHGWWFKLIMNCSNLSWWLGLRVIM